MLVRSIPTGTATFALRTSVLVWLRAFAGRRVFVGKEVPRLHWAMEPKRSGRETTADSTTSNERADNEHQDRLEINAAIGGNGEAYEQLVRRYQQSIANYVWRFTTNPTDYEELVQTVFVEAYYSLVKFRGTGSFRGWLLTIATRVGYAYWRQQGRLKKRNNVPLTPEIEPATIPPPFNAEIERLQAALENLAPRDRLVLTLLYLEERSVAEAAQLAGWSETMVKVQAFRARAKLRTMLERATP